MKAATGNATPHGGTLVDRVLRGALREAMTAQALRMPRVALSPMGASDLELIAVGAFSPLRGFLTRADYEQVLEEMRLTSGLVWSLPVTLPVSGKEAEALGEGQEVALTVSGDPGAPILGVLQVAEKFTYDKEREARRVYQTTDERHPGVARLYAQGDVLLGGEVWLLEHPSGGPFAEFRHTPAQTRRLFAARGWQSVVGFQTRNPIHRAHEYIQKTALEITDGLFLHPLVGETKADDIPPDVRMASYQALLRDYYPPERVVLGVFPAAMRYAGPREAIFHALCRKNYGCTHFIVGRDHAGVGSFYGPTDAQRIFSDFADGELGITPLFFDNTFYCRKCGGIVSSKTCPHDPSHHVVFTGTQVRRMLEAGELLPAEFTRPEVAQILMEGLRRRDPAADLAMDNPARPAASVETPRSAEAPSAGVGTVRNGRRKVFVVGLDCAEPSLVFGKWREALPTLNSLMRGGTYGTLESIIPCITVPAWACMMSNRDPGELGIYGFHNRPDHSYDRMTIATSASVREPLLWDILGPAGRPVVTVGVPPAYPPKPVNGVAVGCFLTPTTNRPYTYPMELGAEIRDLVGQYMVDVPNFRTEDKDDLLRQIYEMTDKRFTVIERFMQTKPWDFFMFVEIGVDRIHHGMWKFHDPTHPKHEPGNRYTSSIFDYYRMLDERIARLIERLDEDTIVWVVSDHGAKKMDGAICLNEWLIREGYLAIDERPAGLAPLEKVEVNWRRTKAWGGGGYYGRIFLNVEGREPHGIIPRGQYEGVRDELAVKLEALTDDRGRPIGTRVFRPENLYRQIRGIPPDLIVYFGDLYWRAVGSIGFERIHTFENDTGPDDANHAQFGLFICHDPRRGGRGQVEGAHITDIGPTILSQMGVEASEMKGRILDLA